MRLGLNTSGIVIEQTWAAVSFMNCIKEIASSNFVRTKVTST
jgi:hypothetical protein